VQEDAGGGADRVFAAGSYTLGNSAEVETLTTTDHNGTAAIDLSGNGYAQVIIGNDGSNVLNGGGGADTLWGRAGNDQYIIGDASAVVQEDAGAGIDRVFANVSYTLGDNAEVEIFTTTDHGGTASINLTGNWRAQYIVGNAGNNVINGGQGADTLAGNGGSDKFLFNTTLGSGNVDVIEDFAGANDMFWLDNAVFTGLTDGALAQSAFRLGTAAADSNDHVIYDSGSGRLYFDTDGTGAAAQVEFARITPGIALTSGNFLVV